MLATGNALAPQRAALMTLSTRRSSSSREPVSLPFPADALSTMFMNRNGQRTLKQTFALFLYCFLASLSDSKDSLVDKRRVDRQEATTDGAKDTALIPPVCPTHKLSLFAVYSLAVFSSP